MTDNELLVIKAKAFDILMKEMDGKEKLITTFLRPIESHITTQIAGRKLNPAASISVDRVNVYEWCIRVNGRKDLKQVLMDSAAAEIGKVVK